MLQQKHISGGKWVQIFVHCVFLRLRVTSLFLTGGLFQRVAILLTVVVFGPSCHPRVSKASTATGIGPLTVAMLVTLAFASCAIVARQRCQQSQPGGRHSHKCRPCVIVERSVRFLASDTRSIMDFQREHIPIPPVKNCLHMASTWPTGGHCGY